MSTAFALLFVLFLPSSAIVLKEVPEANTEAAKEVPNASTEAAKDDVTHVMSLDEARLTIPDKGCRDAVEGDWCYRNAAWAKSEGILKHPDWYQGLTDKSSILEFQEYYHRDNRFGCSKPCSMLPGSKLSGARIAKTPGEILAERAQAEKARITEEAIEKARDAARDVAASKSLAVVNESAPPFMAASVQFALTQSMYPLKEKLKGAKAFVEEKVKEMEGQLKELKKSGLEKADEAKQDSLEKANALLVAWATQVSSIMTSLNDKLNPMTNVAGPVLQATKGILDTAGYPGAADKLGEALDEMSSQVSKYKETLLESSKLADSLKELGKDNLDKADPIIQKIRENLNSGLEAVKSAKVLVEEKVNGALKSLASTLEVDEKTFEPVEKTSLETWDLVDVSAEKMSVGATTSAAMLPPEVVTMPDIVVKGAALGLRGAAGAVTMALLAFAL